MSQGGAKEAVLLGRVGGHAGKWMKGEEGRLNVRIAAPTSVEEREPTAQDGEKQEEGSQSLTAANMKDILLLVISSIRRY